MTTREATKKKRELIDAEGPSNGDNAAEINKRIDNLEASILRIASNLEKMTENQGKLPTYKRPEDRVKAMKQAELGDEQAISLQRHTDLRFPGAERTGFKEGDIIQLKPESEKYFAYCLDETGQPVKQLFEYQCQVCPQVEPFIRGRDKRVCPKCGGVMVKMATTKYQAGAPAYGVVLNFLYKTKKGGNKYKVNFPDFGKPPQGNDALTDSELVLCQKS